MHGVDSIGDVCVGIEFHGGSPCGVVDRGAHAVELVEFAFHPSCARTAGHPAHIELDAACWVRVVNEVGHGWALSVGGEGPAPQDARAPVGQWQQG